MGLFGATEEVITKMGGGLVLGTDPSELDKDQASSLLNVDLYDEAVTVRLGRAKLNTSAVGTGGVLGAVSHYFAGGNRKLAMRVGTGLYADLDGNGSFETSIETALTAGATFADFCPWKDRVYFGDGVNAVRVWDGGATSELVQTIPAPSTAPEMVAVQSQAEAFDAGTWNISGTSITRDQLTASENTKDGGGALRLTATAGAAVGSYVYKTWAATDLSKAEKLILWAYVPKIGPVVQVAIIDNDNNVDFSKFGVVTPKTRQAWEKVEVPLSGLAPEKRSAALGIAIRWVDDGGIGYPNNPVIILDDARPMGFLPIDEYEYFYTWAEANADGQIVSESNPSPAGTIEISDTPPTLGATVTYSGPPSATGAYANVNKVRLWRYQKNGTFADAKLIDTVDNPGTSTTDTYDDFVGPGTIAREDRESMRDGRADPPVAMTYAIVNNRMAAGNILGVSVDYPYRVMLSRLGYPDQFADDEGTDDAFSAGYIDLATRDPIQRIIGYDGDFVIFCETAIHTLQGTGLDEMVVRERAEFGLVARNAVTIYDRRIYFLASDGLRVLQPNRLNEGTFDCWLVSEPVNEVLTDLTATQIAAAALGVDRQGRILLSIPATGDCLIFDPSRPGALDQDLNPKRRGWTRYDNWGFAGFTMLKRGGGDNGELLGWSSTAGTLWTLGTGNTDDATAISWHWESSEFSAPSGVRLCWGHAIVETDAAAASTYVITVKRDKASATHTHTQTLTKATGVERKVQRLSPNASYSATIRVSGTSRLTVPVRTIALGYYERV